MANWGLPTVADTWANILAFFKNRDEDLARALDPATTSPTGLPTNSIGWSSANSRWEKYNGTSWSALTGTYAINISGSAGSVAYSDVTGKPTTLSGYGITDGQPLDADLTAIAALASTGFAARTALNTWAQRTFTAPAAGLTITNPAGVAGNPTFALANDLAALEALASTGVPERTATDTWSQFTVSTFAKTFLDDTSSAAVLATLAAAALGANNAWTIQQRFPTATLTDGANIAWNLNTQQTAKVTLGGNRTLDNPSNMSDGGNYTLRVIQDGTGGRTLSFGTAYKWDSGTEPDIDTTPGAITIFSFHSDGSSMHGGVFSRGSA